MAKGLNLSGLGALFGEEALIDDQVECAMIPVAKISTAAGQARKYFDEELIDELADSIKEHGIIQPLTVRQLQDGCYEIIAGERRWRAARKLNMDKVPARIIEADDRQAMEMGLVENLQREDLNPIEEAQGFHSLINDYELTQEQAAKQVGKSRAAVTNALRLLELPEDVLALVSDKTLSAGHARTLLGLDDRDSISEAAEFVVKNGLSVRATEEYVKKCNAQQDISEESDASADEAETCYYSSLEEKITQAIGCKVRISHTKRKKTISISYKDAAELEELIRKLVGENQSENLFV